MTIYELNDKLELSNGRARKEVSKNEVIIAQYDDAWVDL